MIFEYHKDDTYYATLNDFYAIIAIRFNNRRYIEGHLYLIPLITEDIRTWGTWVYPHDSSAAYHATLDDVLVELITHIPMVLLIQGTNIQDIYDEGVKLFEGLEAEPDRLQSILHTPDQQGVSLYDFTKHRMSVFYEEGAALLREKLGNRVNIVKEEFIGYHRTEYGSLQRIVEVTWKDGSQTWTPSVRDIVLGDYTEKPDIEPEEYED